MIIKTIVRKDPLLADVIALGKKNARTLGMFPDGAFYEHAAKKFILGAIESDRLAGYLLFRITQSHQLISITHLCIHSNHRGNGVAGKLIDHLREKYQYQTKGIVLSCREDYKEASGFWKKYGFKPVEKRIGRNSHHKSLIKWRYDFGNNDLFSTLYLQTERTKALLDANIIVKLRDENCPENIEAISLQADWLADEVEYYYAPEIYNEINRDGDKARAEDTRKFVQSFEIARFKPHIRDAVFQQLKSILCKTSENDLSDRMQLAECIAAGLEYFITMDTGILDKSEQIYDDHKVKIMRPLDFILFLDQLHNSTEKAPARILWYVSGDPLSAIDRHGGIVATSYLEEVYIGAAKSLFQRFKNFGIYEWSNIIKLAKGDAFSEIKAIRFSDTEVFKKVISYREICGIMQNCERKPNSFASPVEVPNEVFNEIYKLSQ